MSNYVYYYYYYFISVYLTMVNDENYELKKGGFWKDMLKPVGVKNCDYQHVCSLYIHIKISSVSSIYKLVNNTHGVFTKGLINDINTTMVAQWKAIHV